MLTTKRKLKEKLKKFKILFGGGPGGKLDIKPINIELKPGTKPYAGTNYNVLKGYSYRAPFQKEGERMVADDILKRSQQKKSCSLVLKVKK